MAREIERVEKKIGESKRKNKQTNKQSGGKRIKN